MKLIDPTQIQTQEPVQIPIEAPITPQPKTNWILIVLSVFSVILLILVALLSLQNQKLKNQSIDQRISPTIQIPSPTPQIVSPISIPPDETAGWKTYINTKYGFSFKYPSEWKVQTGIPNSGLISLEMSNDNRFFVWFSPSVTISEWLEKTQSGKIIRKKTVVEYTFTVIQGGSNLESLEYALDVKGNGIVRFVIEPNSNNSESEKIFDQILSTFKFLNTD